jgi:hypothetical protein
MEAPTPTIAPITRTTIADAIEHSLKLKTGKTPDTYHKSERLLGKLRTFMEASPRAYQYITSAERFIKGGAAPFPHRESRGSHHKRRDGFAVYQ